MANSDYDVYIPDNYDTGSKFIGIPYRNIIEGLILGGGLLVLEWQIPFVFNIKITVGLILFCLSMLICCIGVKGESTSQFLYSSIVFFFRRRRMHLQHPDVVSKSDEKEREKLEKKANMDKTINNIKGKFIK